jgi:RimJ/RimL family protein N-acetyltransferase
VSEMTVSIQVLEMAFPHESHLSQLIATAEDGTIVGTVTVKFYDDIIEFVRLFIPQKYRRHGIGTLLVRRIITIAKSQNIQSVTCQCHRKNADAAAFYHRLGFFKTVSWDSDHAQMTLRTSVPPDAIQPSV